ncbi:MAG: D-alanyl-D-alanine carboxypeptidase [Clostridia bacterium]|nr:D-alanyl-D-alanine carboxypeptidase [Clostridia bacterium]
MKKRILCLLLIMVILLPINVYAEEANIELEYNRNEQEIIESIPVLGSKAVYIANPDTGKVFYEKNAHEKMYPASTTKILTALVTMENCEMTDVATVSQRALDLVPSGYSNANLQAGETHTIKDFLYALLLPSANEAANVLAEHVSGSVEEFVELCNRRAQELGCETLHFTNTNGMHDDNHYCSAYDLYLIAKECQKYEIFNEIVKTRTYTLPSTDIYPGERVIKNTNELLHPGTYYYSNCTGIKTGHTTPAGECLVASSSFDNINLISVVLGGETVNSHGLNDRFYDTKNLFEFMYDNYEIKKIADQGDAIATLEVGKAVKHSKILDLVVNTDMATIIPKEVNKDDIKKTVSINSDIIAPIEANEVLGQVTYHADGLNYTTNIVASHPVEKLPFALYNTIVAGSFGLLLIIFIALLRAFKRHRIVVLIFEIIVITIICVILNIKVKKFKESFETQINLVPNVTIEKND